MTKSKFYLLIPSILLSFNTLSAQLEGIILDGLTQQPIPYINIWVAGENIGTTSNEKGRFVLDKVDPQDTIVFSGIGYQTIEKKLQKGFNSINLAQQNIELEEVLVSASKAVKTTYIGGFKKSKINFYFGSSAQPKIRARYFPFKPSYENSLIKTISINTRSEVKNARFHVRIYEANENGKPGAFLHDKVIKGMAQKGNQKTEIEVSRLNLTFPKNGIFIAIEWLIIDQNKYLNKGKNMETKKKVKEVAYAPLIGIMTSEENENSWIFENGQWSKLERNPDYLGKSARNKFNVIAMELVLIK